MRESIQSEVIGEAMEALMDGRTAMGDGRMTAQEWRHVEQHIKATLRKASRAELEVRKGISLIRGQGITSWHTRQTRELAENELTQTLAASESA